MPGIKHRPRKGTSTKWKDEYYVTCYELARSGCNRNQMASALGVRVTTLLRWLQAFPALRDAIKRGHSISPGDRGTLQDSPAAGERFFDYVYHRLPAKYQSLWDEIQGRSKSKSAYEEVEELLNRHDPRVRKLLFAQALCCSFFNKSEAQRKLNVAPSTFNEWITNDPSFVQLLADLKEMFKDWCEGNMLALVAARDPSVCIHVNKSVNADRGYNPSARVKQDINASVLHEVMDTSELDSLPLEDRRRIRDAIRAKREQKQLTLEGKVIS